MDLKLFSDDYDRHKTDLSRWPDRYDFQTMRNYVMLQASDRLTPQQLIQLANQYQLVNPGEPNDHWEVQFTYDRQLMQFGYVQYLMATYYTLRYHILHSDTVTKVQKQFMTLSIDQYVREMAEKEANRSQQRRQYDHFDLGPSLDEFLKRYNLTA